MYRVILAEDSVLLREGLAGLLQRFGFTVQAAVSDAATLLAAVDAGEPDIVVTDVRMPPTFTDEGLRAALALRAARPRLPVLVLSQYVEQTYAAELLNSGGDAGTGYLLKDRIGEVTDFAEAVDAVAAGGTVVDPEVVRQLLEQRRGPLQRLTPREQEVLGLMAEGRSAGPRDATMPRDAPPGGCSAARMQCRADAVPGRGSAKRKRARQRQRQTEARQAEAAPDGSAPGRGKPGGGAHAGMPCHTMLCPLSRVDRVFVRLRPGQVTPHSGRVRPVRGRTRLRKASACCAPWT